MFGAMIARRLLPVAIVVAVSPGCGAAPPVATAPVGALCSPDQIDACERRLAKALADQDPSKPLAAAYAAARASRDSADGWARLYRELDAADRGPRPAALVLVEGTSPPSGVKGVRVVLAPSLPAPSAIAADDLLLALAAATGYQHVVRVRGAVASQLFPGDPLAPLMGGLRPVLHDPGALAHLEADLAAEDALRAAFEAASSFRYVEAAKAATTLASLVDGRDRREEPAARWQQALQALAGAGLVLDAEESVAATPDGPRPEVPPVADEAPPSAAETPYGGYLRVLAAKDGRKAWDLHGDRVLEGVAADRRDAFASLFGRPRACDARRPPPMEGVRDLVFANRLSGALPRDPSAPIAPGQLPLREWLERYQALVELVERTRSAWAYLPALLYQRGDAHGLSVAGTPLYKRVTDLGLAHMAATRALEEAYPVRYRAFTQITLAMSPGAVGDDRLRQALVKLTEVSVADKIAAAKDAEGLLLGLAAGAAAGLSYPPALQEAHLLALSGATAARLKGDFLAKTGWGVALLYAIDGAYRLIAGQGPNLGFSSAQIARALGAPEVEPRALASLATAAAKYAALAADRKLDATASAQKLGHDRRAAQGELRAALAGLGSPGEAPADVLDDLTTLTDGLVATLSSAALAGAAKKPPPKAGTCTPKASPVPLDAGLRRALGRLGDVRRRILLHPRYKQGDGVWVRRVRLVVTVLSDAMDLALASDAPMRAGARRRPIFTIPNAEAQKAAEDALRELDQKGVTELVGGGYGLFRELAAVGDPEELLKRSSRDLRRVATGLLALFRGDALGGKGPATGVALLDALAGMRGDAPATDDVVTALATYAGAFYAKNQTDQGDLCMLASLVLSSLTKRRPPAAMIELATRANSRIAWVLRFSEEVHRSGGQGPDPSAYADEMRKATDDACQTADAEATLAVVRAIHNYGSGRRREAREALDRALETADDTGLGVPRMVYRYEEKTATKVFQVTVDLSYANGILLGGNSFQLGAGFRSTGEPGGSLTSTLAPLDTAKAGEDAARFYVYTAALATVYHFLDGDADRALATGRRVVVALSAGLKLGSRMLRGEKPGAWGADSQEILVLAAQLAAEAGQSFLAGDLWTVVRQGFSETLDDKAVAGMLDQLPLGVAGVKDLKPVVERAKRSLKVLAAPLPCADHKVEVGGFEEVACAEYPLALSLRIADVLKKLPRLRRGAESSRQCGPLKSLDAFLAGGDKGAYDPDAFTHAVEDLRADGKIYDAAILLTRQKHPSHCTPPIVAAARSLGRSPALGPWIRSDLLSAAVNCTAAGGGADVGADLALLDADTRKLLDPSRNLRLVFSVADLATRTDRWEMLASLVEQPDFVGRWMGIHPNAAAAALLLDHAVAAIAGKPVGLERTSATQKLLCETFKSAERADVCGMIDALRAPLAGPMAERQRLAKEMVKKLVAVTAAPAHAGKRP